MVRLLNLLVDPNSLPCAHSLLQAMISQTCLVHTFDFSAGLPCAYFLPLLLHALLQAVTSPIDMATRWPAGGHAKLDAPAVSGCHSVLPHSTDQHPLLSFGAIAEGFMPSLAPWSVWGESVGWTLKHPAHSARPGLVDIK